jgi:nitrogenase molybdenum-iron protein alpha/beta subunit
MKVLVFGSKDYTDYNEFIRQMTVLIDDRKHWHPEDKEYIFIHKGLRGAENMVTEYIGKVEKLIRQNGYKIKEELVRDKSSFSDVTMIESAPDFALVFGISERNKSCIKLLEAYGIPYRSIKE